MTKYGQYTVPSSDTCVNLGVGQPAKEFLPLNLIKKGIQEQLEENDPDLLQYGDIPGYYSFRKSLSRFLNFHYAKQLEQFKKSVSPDNLFITCGVTQALSMICSLLTKSGDTVFVEEPTYFLAINIFKENNLNIKAIPMDDNGIIVSELKKHIKPNENNILYTIPSFHNPTGITMTHERRKELVAIDNLTIIADEVYQLLYFDTPPPPPLRYYSDNVISLGSFSKILAPSLRLGWIDTSNKFMKVFCDSGILDSSGGLNPIISSFVHKIIDNGDLDKNLIFLRKELKDRCTTLSKSLLDNQEKIISKQSDKSIIDFRIPDGGYFIWLKTQLNCYNYDSTNFKVKFHNGSKFSSNLNYKNYMRLSFSYYNCDDIKIGAKRIIDVINDINRIEDKKIKISLLGANGRLGSLIRKEIFNSSDYTLHNVIERNYSNNFFNNTKVIIDVSSPEGNTCLLDHLILNKLNIPLIIGTTGDLNFNKIKSYSKIAPVALISNFSEGIPILKNIISQTKLSDCHYNISEIHHIHKKDKPSGTAINLKNCIDKTVKIESIRQGEVFGEHVVSIENDNEKIEFKHIAKNRNIFAKGALNYIPFILNKSNGIYYGKDNNVISNGFTKYSGSGNDFIIIDNRDQSFNGNIKELCTRGTSIGADGLILVENTTTEHDFRWIYFNSDGKKAELCGNGARCVSHFALNNNIVSKNEMSFVNDFNIITHAIVKNNIVSVSLPKEKFINIEPYLEKQIRNIILYNVDSIKLILIGVLHLVISINETIDFSAFNIKDISKKIIEIMPREANINYLFKRNNQVRTYEKGVYDETNACGTGCAACLISMESNEESFTVKSGEKLKLYKENDTIYLEGGTDMIYNVS